VFTLALLPITATICAGMPVTLSDIARELGVSKMTVSRAINNNALISAETRQRVLEVARRMNYQPNQHARALATNRSYLIGVVVPDLMNLYFAEVARAIESIARPAGFQLLICSTDEDASREIGEVEVLLQRTDGLIISSVLAPTDTGAYRKMMRDGAKIVLVDRTMRNLHCPVVATDNVQVGRIATEHLISLGHVRIGHLSGDASSVSTDRLEGYKRALQEHGLRFNNALLRPGDAQVARKGRHTRSHLCSERSCGYWRHEGAGGSRYKDWRRSSDCGRRQYSLR